MRRPSPKIALTLLVLALVLPPVETIAQVEGDECADYAVTNPLVGWRHLGGRYYDFALRNDIMYAVGPDRFTLFDVSDPSDIRQIRDVELDGYYRQIELVGDQAFLGGGSNAPLSVWDLSDPEDPVFRDDVQVGYSYGFHAGDGFVFTTDAGSSEIRIYDTQTPGKIHHAADLRLAGTVRQTAVKGRYAIVRVDGVGMFAIDASDPANPVIAGSFGYDLPGRYLHVDGDFLIAQSFGIHVFDIANLPLFRYLGKKTEIASYNAVSNSDHLITFSEGGMHVFDSSRLPELHHLRFIPHAEGSYKGVANDNVVNAAVGGSTVSLLRAIDFRVDTDQQDPDWSSFQYYTPSRMRIHESRLFSGHAHGVDIFEPNGPDGPVLLAQVGDRGGGVQDFGFAGDKLVVQYYGGDLVVFDISDLSRIHILGSVNIGPVIPNNRASTVAVGNGYAFIGTRRNVGDEGYIVVVAIEGDQAYTITEVLRLDDWISGLTMVDGILVATIRKARIATFGVPDHPQDVEIRREKCASLRELGSLELDLGFGARDLITIGHHACFVSTGQVRMLNIDNPTEPHIAGTCSLPVEYRVGKLAYDAGWLYVSTPDLGVTVIDASDLRNPEVHGFVSTFGYNKAVAASLDRLFVSFYPDELRQYSAQCALPPLEFVIDIKPSQGDNFVECRSKRGIVPVAVISSPGRDAAEIDHTTVRFGIGEAEEIHFKHGEMARHLRDIDGDGDTDLLFHFRFGDTGIKCGDTSVTLTGKTYDGRDIRGSDAIQTEPDSPDPSDHGDLVRINPNPFNPQTTVSFLLEESEHVRVSIHDVRGRLVKLLVDEALAAGTHSVKWQGRDTGGQPVASGTYFFRFEAGAVTETRKAVVMR